MGFSSCGPRGSGALWRDLPGPGIEPIVPCIGRRILKHWTTRKVLFLLFTFWSFGCKACGILAPWPGIESAHPPLNTGLPGKSLFSFLDTFLPNLLEPFVAIMGVFLWPRPGPFFSFIFILPSGSHPALLPMVPEFVSSPGFSPRSSPTHPSWCGSFSTWEARFPNTVIIIA